MMSSMSFRTKMDRKCTHAMCMEARQRRQGAATSLRCQLATAVSLRDAAEAHAEAVDSAQFGLVSDVVAVATAEVARIEDLLLCETDVEASCEEEPEEEDDEDEDDEDEDDADDEDEDDADEDEDAPLMFDDDVWFLFLYRQEDTPFD